MPQKKIAIVHDFLVRYGGAEALVKAWAEEFPDADIFTLFYDEKKMGKFFPKERVSTSYLQFWYSLTKRYTWMFPFMPRAIESFNLSNYDIVLSSSAAFSHGALTSYEQKHVSYIHSPVRWCWDSHFSFMKERNMGFFQRWFFQKWTSSIRVWDTFTADRPDVLLAASTEIQKRIQKYWRKESEIVFPFVDLDRFKIAEKSTSSDEYFLIVSQLVPYKRINIAIEACNKLGLPLKIVGEGIERKKLEKIAGNTVEFIGSKYDDELVEIMKNAKAFLFPGIDDFGMTVIESMACGVPVIAYKKAGVLDTVKEGVSGLFFEEQSVESLVSVLQYFDISQFNKEKTRDHAKQFSKEKHLNSIRKSITSN